MIPIHLFLELNPVMRALASVAPNPFFIFFAGLGLTMVPVFGIMIIHQKSSDVKKH